jgi:hypothetical protein
MFRVACVLTLSIASAPLAFAGQINTGGETGAYHATFCPQIATALRKNKFDFACTPSQGSLENIQRVAADPAQVGFSQLDAFALETENLGSDKLFTRIRTDVARECLFMVTRNRGVTNFGQVASVASQLHFVLPPQKSGSAATFQLLQRIDPEGLGLARNVTYAASVDEAITQAMAADDAVTLFVQFPDPSNVRFQSIVKAGGNIVPVIDRAILRQEANGEKIYFAEETEIAPAKWNKSADKIATACTPLVLFTGASDRIADANDRKDQDDLVRTVRSLAVEELRPKVGTLTALWRKTKALSAQSMEKLMALSDKAREQAKPTIDAAMKKAQEMTDEAKKQAQDLIEKAKKATDGSGN